MGSWQKKWCGGGMNDTDVFTPRKQSEAIILVYDKEHGMTLQENSEGLYAPLCGMHYSISGFEGAKVNLIPAEGTHKLLILHYDWNIARLNKQLEFWNLGGLGMNMKDHMLALVNLLYANGWDKHWPVTLTKDGTGGKPASYLYVRPYIYQPEYERVSLCQAREFSFMLMVHPEADYHEPGGKFGVLRVPQWRELPNPEYKISENYGLSTRWAKAYIGIFLEWAERENPPVVLDGRELHGEEKEGAIASMKKNLKDVLFHDRRGHLTEGMASNVGIIEGNILKTPPIWRRALPGLTMQKIELIFQEILGQGRKAKRQNIYMEDFVNADLAFFSANACGMKPVEEAYSSDWTCKDGIYMPCGAVHITTVKNSLLATEYPLIKGELDKINNGTSDLGSFTLDAEKFMNAKQAERIHDVGHRLHRMTRRMENFRLIGKTPKNYRTKLANDKQLSQAKFLNIH